MQQIRRNLELLSQADLPVLLQGESGTGKSTVADWLHQQSRGAGTLVKIDCLSGFDIASVSAAETFGAPDVAAPSLFTGQGGTLILDKLDELDHASQAKLLLVLAENPAAHGGGGMRVISTTNVSLQELADSGRFRVDLLYRVNAVKLVLPPLRQRSEDIPGLIEYFLEKHSREAFRTRRYLSTETMQMMEGYYWPGNIRQLDHLVRNFVLLGSEDVIVQELMQPDKGMSGWAVGEIDVSSPVALKEITRRATHELERQIILKVLKANGWNRQRTAKWLQISYRSLLYKLSDFGATRSSQPLEERGFRAASF